MPYVRERQTASVAPRQGPTGVENAPISGPTGDWLNLGAYFSLNQPQAQQMAQGVTQNLTQDANAALGGMRPDVTAAQHSLSDLKAAQTQPGLAALMSENKGADYSGGMGGLDAYLAGRAGGAGFDALGRQFSTSLGSAGTQSAAPTIIESSLNRPSNVLPKYDGFADAFDKRRRRF